MKQRDEAAKGRESKEARKLGERGPPLPIAVILGSCAGSRIQATSLHALQSPSRMLLEQCYNSIHLAQSLQADIHLKSLSFQSALP